jgi:hypothetical protein
MRFTLEIQCDNSAFHACDEGDSDDVARNIEVGRLLHRAAEYLDRGMERRLIDSNGNTVGSFRFED